MEIELQDGVEAGKYKGEDCLGEFDPTKEYGMWAWISDSYVGKMFEIMDIFVPNEHKKDIEIIYKPNTTPNPLDRYSDSPTIGWKIGPVVEDSP